MTLATLFFLALAVSPFTAPFQTCGMTTDSSLALIEESDPGSLVSPLATQEGRLKIALPVGLGSSGFVALCPVTFITRSIPPTGGVGDRSIISTILRL